MFWSRNFNYALLSGGLISSFQVSRANRRYIVGVILSDGTFKLDPEIQKKMESAGFKVTEWPTVKTCVQATFPYMNIISIFIAVRKVYPKLSRFIVVSRNYLMDQASRL